METGPLPAPPPPPPPPAERAYRGRILPPPPGWSSGPAEAELGDMLSAAFENQLLNGNANSDQVALSEAYARLIRKGGEVGLQAPSNPIDRFRSEQFGSQVRNFEDYLNDWHTKVDEQLAANPELAQRMGPITREVIGAMADQISRDAFARYSELKERRGEGFWSFDTLAEFGVMMGASLVDPMQASTAGIGGTSKTVVGAVAKGAAVNMGIEAALQPFVTERQVRIGNFASWEEGIGQAATNIAFAGALGGLLSGGGKAVEKFLFSPNEARQEAVQTRPESFEPAREAMTALARAAEPMDPESAAIIRKATYDAERDFETLRQAPEGFDRDEFVDAVEAADARVRGLQEFIDRPSVRREAPERMLDTTDDGPAPELNARLTEDGKPVTFTRFDPRELGVAPDEMQYKRFRGEDGVNDANSDVGEWHAPSSGKVLVFERTNGERVIVDGHQRRALARGMMDRGREDIRLDGYLYREADGWTAADMRLKGAQKNIREGRSDVLDTAQALRERADAIDASFPVSRSNIRQARQLARLSDDAWDLTRAGVLEPQFAALIGQVAPDRPQIHAPLARTLIEAAPENVRQAETIISEALLDYAERDVATQASLFGDDNLGRAVMYKERAQIMDAAYAWLRSERSVFKALVEKGDIARALGNELVDAANLTAKDQVELAIAAVMHSRRAGVRTAVSDMISRALDSVRREGVTPTRAGQQVAREIRALVEERGFQALMTPEGPRPPEFAEAGPLFDGPGAKANVEQADLLEGDLRPEGREDPGVDLAKIATPPDEVAGLVEELRGAGEGGGERTADQILADIKAMLAPKKEGEAKPVDPVKQAQQEFQQYMQAENALRDALVGLTDAQKVSLVRMQYPDSYAALNRLDGEELDDAIVGRVMAGEVKFAALHAGAVRDARLMDIQDESFTANATQDVLESIQRAALAAGKTPPVFRLFRDEEGRVVAWDAEKYSHAEAREILDLGDSFQEHGQFRWGSQLDRTDWYDRSGARGSASRPRRDTRLERATAMGFTQRAFHETQATPDMLAEGFDLSRRQAATGDYLVPIGVFTKPTDASIGIGKTQIPLLLRPGKTRTFADRAALEAHLSKDERFKALVAENKALDEQYNALYRQANAAWLAAERLSPEWSQLNETINNLLKQWTSDANALAEHTRKLATDILKAEGLNSITITKDVGASPRPVRTTIVFDSRDIRHADAAFDPAQSNSSRLMASVGGQSLGATPDELLAAIRTEFGDGAMALVRAGELNIAYRPPRWAPDGVMAITDANRRVTIYSSAVDAADMRGIILHEVGIHAGIERILGKQGRADLLNQVQARLDAGDEAFLTASKRVPIDTDPAHVLEETLAYLVQHAPRNDFVQRLLADIRTWFYRTFPKLREWMTLTEADMQSLAIGSVRSAIRAAEAEVTIERTRIGGVAVDAARYAKDDPFGIPRFPRLGYDARDLILMFNDSVGLHRMASELTLALGRAMNPDTLNRDLTRIRHALRKLRVDPEQYAKAAAHLGVDVQELDAYIDDIGGVREPTMQGEARRLFDEGTTDAKSLIAGMKAWHEANRPTEPMPSQNVLAATASRIRKEAGASESKNNKVTTPEQRSEVEAMRMKGLGSLEISKALNLPYGNVQQVIKMARDRGVVFPNLGVAHPPIKDRGFSTENIKYARRPRNGSGGSQESGGTEVSGGAGRPGRAGVSGDGDVGAGAAGSGDVLGGAQPRRAVATEPLPEAPADAGLVDWNERVNLNAEQRAERRAQFRDFVESANVTTTSQVFMADWDIRNGRMVPGRGRRVESRVFHVAVEDNWHPDWQEALAFEETAVRVEIHQGEAIVPESHVSPAFRSTGLGQKLYMRAIDEMLDQGIVINSDVNVSENAIAMWKSLRKHGYDVIQRVPDSRLERGEDGMFSHIGEPVSVFFVARKKPALPEPLISDRDVMNQIDEQRALTEHIPACIKGKKKVA